MRLLSRGCLAIDVTPPRHELTTIRGAPAFLHDASDCSRPIFDDLKSARSSIVSRITYYSQDCWIAMLIGLCGGKVPVDSIQP